MIEKLLKMSLTTAIMIFRGPFKRMIPWMHLNMIKSQRQKSDGVDIESILLKSFSEKELLLDDVSNVLDIKFVIKEISNFEMLYGEKYFHFFGRYKEIKVPKYGMLTKFKPNEVKRVI
jgi:hypothetical protein